MKNYNLDTIRTLADGDTEFIAAMVGVFLEEIPADMEELTAAVSENDRKKAGEYAHKMKPTFDMFGIKELKDVKIIEAWGRAEEAMNMNIDSELKRIQEAVQLVSKELRQDFGSFL